MLERSGDEEQVAKLKKDLKKTKALLKDAQLMLDKSQNEGTSKVIMRQLKNQVGGIKTYLEQESPSTLMMTNQIQL